MRTSKIYCDRNIINCTHHAVHYIIYLIIKICSLWPLHFSHTLSLATINLFSVSRSLAFCCFFSFFNFSHEWEHMGVRVCVCVCVSHVFLIDLFISGPTGCFYNLAAKNNDAVTWGCIYVSELVFYFLQINTQKWDYCLIW